MCVATETACPLQVVESQTQDYPRLLRCQLRRQPPHTATPHDLSLQLKDEKGEGVWWKNLHASPCFRGRISAQLQIMLQHDMQTYSLRFLDPLFLVTIGCFRRVLKQNKQLRQASALNRFAGILAENKSKTKNASFLILEAAWNQVCWGSGVCEKISKTQVRKLTLLFGYDSSSPHSPLSSAFLAPRKALLDRSHCHEP